MSPQAIAILAAVTAVGNAVAEGFRWAQTDEGKLCIAKAREDAAAREKFLTEIGTGLQRFFQGGYFK